MFKLDKSSFKLKPLVSPKWSCMTLKSSSKLSIPFELVITVSCSHLGQLTDTGRENSFDSDADLIIVNNYDMNCLNNWGVLALLTADCIENTLEIRKSYFEMMILKVMIMKI